MRLTLKFWEGLGAAHSKWASKDPNMKDITQVLETARDNYEMMENAKEVGVVDGNASDSSDEDESEDEGETQANGTGDTGKKGPMEKVKDLKKHGDSLQKHNRGLMQWKVSRFTSVISFQQMLTQLQLPRTAQWAAHKVERTESRFSGLFKHHTRQPDVETEV